MADYPAQTLDVPIDVVQVGGITPPAPDTTPPTVTYVSPTPGAQLDVDGSVVVDVTDNLDRLARAIFALAIAETGVTELVHDGTAFTARYVAGSTRSAIADGYRFELRRTGGWPDGSITVRVFASDLDGNLES